MPANRLYRHSKIDEDVFIRLMRAFCDDASATEAAKRCGVSVRAANDIYIKLRQRVVDEVFSNDEIFNGSGECLKTQLHRKGFKEFLSDDGKHPILYEIFRCCSAHILDRITERGVKVEYILNHAVEIYVRSRAVSVHSSIYSNIFSKEYKSNVVDAVSAVAVKNYFALRLNLQRILPPVCDYFGNLGGGTEVWDDLFWSIWRKPI